MRLALPFLVFLILISASCKNQTDQIEEHFVQEEPKGKVIEAKEVIYSMYLPTDMAEVFTHSGSNYEAHIPAPFNDFMLYNDPEQIAIMLGIYGVDLMYAKLMDQSLIAGQYYKTIESLSEKLSIPSEVFEESTLLLEKYLSNEDSLAFVIEQIYSGADQYYKQNGKDNLAALSLIGGWIEAMYIGVEIFKKDSGNLVMAERLLQQKYSLNSIYTIVSNYQESLSVTAYVLMLKKLRKAYDNVQIRYQKEGFSVDTAQKKLQTLDSYIDYDKETLENVIRIIPQIRNEMIRVSEET